MKNDNIYSDNYAMDYEYLIRRAHQCGRWGVAGANADEYRRFIRSASMYKSEKELVENNKPREWGEPLDKMLANYMANAGKIVAYIKTATGVVKKEQEDVLTDEQYNKLEDAEVLLNEIKVENIVTAMKMAEEVMLEIKLYPK